VEGWEWEWEWRIYSVEANNVSTVECFNDSDGVPWIKIEAVDVEAFDSVYYPC
jgi:hypothetical protein